MKERIRQVTRRLGPLGWLRLALYPVTVLVTTPIRWLQSLWSFRVLFDGRWGDYSCTTPYYGIANLFYMTMASNLYRHGRFGTSSTMGVGNFRLSALWFQALPGLYGYWRLAPIGPLIGMGLAWASLALWGPSQQVALVMGLVLCSSAFYVQTLMMQAYPSLGWMFFPAGLLALTTGHPLLATLAWLGISFASLTVTAIATVLCLVWAVATGDWWTALTPLPACVKFSFHFLPNLRQGDLVRRITDIAKSIGVTRGPAKYRTSRNAPLTTLYFLALYGQFALYLTWSRHPWQALLWAGMGLLVMNATVLRFADQSTFSALFLWLTTGAMMQAPDPGLLLSGWLAITPLPLVECEILRDQILDVVPRLGPFRIRELREAMRDFLSPVPSGSRVLMAFDDPGGIHANLFDGQRAILELPLSLADERGFLLLPSEWATIACNYPGAPDFWGRSVEQVLERMAQWQADFAIVYRTDGDSLGPEWERAGFEALGRFRWGGFPGLEGRPPYDPTAPPEWFLLRLAKRSADE